MQASVTEGRFKGPDAASMFTALDDRREARREQHSGAGGDAEQQQSPDSGASDDTAAGDHSDGWALHSRLDHPVRARSGSDDKPAASSSASAKPTVAVHTVSSRGRARAKQGSDGSFAITSPVSLKQRNARSAVRPCRTVPAGSPQSAASPTTGVDASHTPKRRSASRGASKHAAVDVSCRTRA
jgi:hypothetical protein